MKKLLSALFLGLFVAAGTPALLHADDMAAGATDTKEATPKKEHKHKPKHKAKHKKAKKAKKAAAADASAAPADAAK